MHHRSKRMVVTVPRSHPAIFNSFLEQIKCRKMINVVSLSSLLWDVGSSGSPRALNKTIEGNPESMVLKKNGNSYYWVKYYHKAFLSDKQAFWSILYSFRPCYVDLFLSVRQIHQSIEVVTMLEWIFLKLQASCSRTVRHSSVKQQMDGNDYCVAGKLGIILPKTTLQWLSVPF